MKHRTRQVLALLADEVNGQVLDLCRGEPRTERELVAETGAARRTITARVSVLSAFGLLMPDTDRGGQPGRPPTRWRPLSVEEVAAFERQADDFADALATD